MPGFPIPPLVFAAASIAMLILAFLERPTESSIALATVALGVPLFMYFKRKQRSVRAHAEDGGEDTGT
jgi:APA family basic amino acid/polyamine antiporter